MGVEVLPVLEVSAAEGAVYPGRRVGSAAIITITNAMHLSRSLLRQYRLPTATLRLTVMSSPAPAQDYFGSDAFQIAATSGE